jgi:hypothetical protein
MLCSAGQALIHVSQKWDQFGSGFKSRRDATKWACDLVQRSGHFQMRLSGRTQIIKLPRNETKRADSLPYMDNEGTAI